jgi:16S rRNA (guanine527-N7)-methyltransferase
VIDAILKSGAAELGIVVTDAVAEALSIYSVELLKWNRKINLTAITAENEIADKHFIDSLYFASRVNSGEKTLDIGSGAGMPAIPLAIARPEVVVVSVDAVAKKVQFQRHIARLLDLENLTALHARVESMGSQYCNTFDLITSRAFSSLELFVRLAKPLLKNEGRLVAMKGPSTSQEISEAEKSIKALGFEITAVSNYDLPSGSGKRCLVELKSV